MKSFTEKLLNGNLKKTFEEFNPSNYEHLFDRMKLISYMLIFTYPCFFIVDFILLKSLNKPLFKLLLGTVHIFGLLISLIFLLIYRNKRVSKSLIVNSYVFLYLLIGAVSSINSQLFTGNIYAYIIILLGVAAVFPIRPRNLFFHYFSVHIFFLIGLYLIVPKQYSYLSMLINSTGTAVISFTIALAFYSFRKNDFLNKLKLKRNEESFRRLFNLNPNPLILKKLASDEIVLMNKQAIEYYHLDGSDLDAGFLFSQSGGSQAIFNRLLSEKSIKNYLTEQQITADLRKWSLLNFELVDYLDETCVLIDTTDITDMKKKEAELIKHASIDMLTGVMNRRSGLELLRGKLAEGTDEFIICYIDINNLKIVNDRYGHSTGDDLIQTSCKMIHRNLDSQDVLFRLGGDEFIVIFSKKRVEDVKEIWNNIQRAFQDRLDKPYRISASYGLYPYKPGTPVTLEEVLELADKEMYKHKALYKAECASLVKG